MVSQPFGERDRDGLIGEMVLVDVVEFMVQCSLAAAFAEVFADNDRESDIVICHSDRFNLCGQRSKQRKDFRALGSISFGVFSKHGFDYSDGLFYIFFCRALC